MSPREEPPTDGSGDESAQPGLRRLRVVALVLLAEALVLAGFAVFLLANLVGGSRQTTTTGNTVIELVAFFATAGVLTLLARGCLQGRRWARAPVIVVQLIALLGIGWPLLQGGVWYRYVVGVPLSLGAAAAIVLVLTPSATVAFDAEE